MAQRPTPREPTVAGTRSVRAYPRGQATLRRKLRRTPLIATDGLPPTAHTPPARLAPQTAPPAAASRTLRPRRAAVRPFHAHPL